MTLIEAHYTTGCTLYLLTDSETGTWWSGATDEDYNAANYATYVVAMTEVGATGIYRATYPAGVPVGNRGIHVKVQAGDSPAAGDIPIAGESYSWDGTTLRSAADAQAIGGKVATAANPMTVGSYVGNETHAIAVNGSGYVTFANTTIATVTNLTNLPAATTDWLTAAAVSAAAVTKIQTGLATPTNITSATGIQLAASQHVIVDSGTVTTLSNLPAIPNNWLTAAGIAAAALNSKGDWSTYGGTDTPGTTTLLTRVTAAMPLASDWTPARAGYLDNLNVGGPVASHADVLAINQSASKHLLIQTVAQYERPEVGSTTYTVECRTFTADTGAAVNADATPTLTATGQTSGDLSANLGVASNPATGVYRWSYSVASGATNEPVRFDVSATISGSTFTLSAYTQVVDVVSATWTGTDATMLTALYNLRPAYAPSVDVSGKVAATVASGDDADAVSIKSTIGVAGVGLTNLGDARLANLNATVSSRSSHSAADVVTALGTGTTLTAVPWNAAWDAEVESECTDALTTWGKTGFSIIGTVTTFDGLLTSLASAHGAGSWLTATGFATPTNVTNGVAAVEGYGDSHWSTAVGFATPSDISGLAATLASAHGAGSWATATSVTVSDKTGFLLSATIGWGGSALPTIGTSTLTAQQVWEYATRTLTAFGFTVASTVSGTVGGIAGTTQTFDALSTLLTSLHGAGAWATATGFATPTNVTDAISAIESYGNARWATADVSALALQSTLNAVGLAVLALGSPLQAGDYTAPLTAASTRDALGMDTANLDAQLAAILAATGAIDVPTVSEIVAGVYGATAADYDDPGTMGEKINAAGSASDPLLNIVPGTYEAHTAGYYIGKLDYILNKVSLITPGTPIIAMSPIISGSTLTLVAGASYLDADGFALQIELAQAPVDDDDICSLAIGTKPTPGQPEAAKLLAVDGIFVEVGSTWYAQFDLTAAQTAALSTKTTDVLVWDLVEILSDESVIPIVSASPCNVTKLISRQ